MSSSSVDQIKSKLDIVSVVGGYVKLEKSGASLKGRCPFHNEKTPSFFVSPERGNYYCFGCGAKGDIFTFVQEFEGLDFPGALKVLAERAGVTLEAYKGDGQAGQNRDTMQALFSVMEQATFYFEQILSDTERQYLQSRGMTDETIKNFRIGYALADWRGLHDFLMSKGVSLEDMQQAGLVKKKDTTVYDTFRSRIIFPIADSSGRVVAFSGRIFPPEADAPKYLNSPETPIFKKSEVLFGLDKAKRDIRLKDYSILVEGQMDLTMLHQIGLTNTVASSGTALTSEQLVRLQRLSNRIIMAYDGDAAGFAAVIRGANIALSLGMEVKIAVMKEGSDPADMAHKDVEELKERLKNAKHVVSFVLDLILSHTPDVRVATRKVVSDVLPFVARIASASEQGHFIREISLKANIKEEALWEDLKKVKREGMPGTSPGSQQGSQQQSSERMPSTLVISKSNLILRKLIGIILWQSKKDPPDISIAETEQKIAEIIGQQQFLEMKIEEMEKSDAVVFEAEAYYNGNTNIVSQVAELVANLEEEQLKTEFTETMQLLHRAEGLKDTEEVARLFARCQEISKQINQLKHR